MRSSVSVTLTEFKSSLFSNISIYTLSFEWSSSLVKISLLILNCCKIQHLHNSTHSVTLRSHSSSQSQRRRKITVSIRTAHVKNWKSMKTRTILSQKILWTLKQNTNSQTERKRSQTHLKLSHVSTQHLQVIHTCHLIHQMSTRERFLSSSWCWIHQTQNHHSLKWTDWHHIRVKRNLLT